MMLRGVMAISLALAFTGASALAQTEADPARKPALLLKPSLWKPKAIQRSQLRPQLKPDFTAAVDEDVYVPPSQVNALTNVTPAGVTPGGVTPVSAAPVQLAATHASVAPATAAAVNALPDATIQDFTGRFLGAGVEVALAPSPNEPPRRMSQVEITGDASEFTVKWATMRIGANFKPETVKSSQQEITFRPSGVPGRYVAVGSNQAGAATDAVAEIKSRTMIVTVNAALPSGQKSIQRYERTLTDRGMDVVFTRTEGGRLVRQVNLTLTKGGGSIWRGL